MLFHFCMFDFLTYCEKIEEELATLDTTSGVVLKGSIRKKFQHLRGLRDLF